MISPEPDDLPDPLDGSPQQSRTRLHNVTSGERATADSNVEAQGLDLDDLQSPLPSLGYLDEALSYIAAERAKWRAVQEEQAVSSVVAGAASDPGDGVVSGDDGEGEGQEGDPGGEGEWRNVVGMFQFPYFISLSFFLLPLFLWQPTNWHQLNDFPLIPFYLQRMGKNNRNENVDGRGHPGHMLKRRVVVKYLLLRRTRYWTQPLTLPATFYPQLQYPHRRERRDPNPCLPPLRPLLSL